MAGQACSIAHGVLGELGEAQRNVSRTPIQRLVKAAVCVPLLCLLWPAGLSAQSAPAASAKAALEVVNRAAVPIADIRLASRAMGTWGFNLLATQIEPGEQRKVLPARQEGCLYSVRVVYRDNRFEHFIEIDLCSNHDYLLGAKIAQPISNQDAYNAPPRPYVRLVNRTSKIIEVIRMSPANSRTWGPNRLPADQFLDPERHVDVPLSANAGCLYRIYSYYRDGLTGILSSADLCEQYNIGLGREPQYRNDQVPAEMRIRAAQFVNVVNRSGFQIDWIYISPANPNQDRLGTQQVLRDGERQRINVADQATCQVTVTAAYQDRQRREEKRVDLCGADEPELVLYGR